VTLEGITLIPGEPSNSGANSVSCSEATLLLQNSTITTAKDKGIFADNCTLTLTQSTVEGNGGIGIEASGGTLTITQSTVSRNTGGGIDIDNADFTIVNNFFVRNGGGDASIPGVSITGGGDTVRQFDFNTVANNLVGPSALATGIDCRPNNSMTATGNIVFGGITGQNQPNLR